MRRERLCREMEREEWGVPHLSSTFPFPSLVPLKCHFPLLLICHEFFRISGPGSHPEVFLQPLSSPFLVILLSQDNIPHQAVLEHRPKTNWEEETWNGGSGPSKESDSPVSSHTALGWGRLLGGEKRVRGSWVEFGQI